MSQAEAKTWPEICVVDKASQLLNPDKDHGVGARVWVIDVDRNCPNLIRFREECYSRARKDNGVIAEALTASTDAAQAAYNNADWNPFSLLMNSTNAAAFNERNALLQQGHSTVDAQQIMLTRRGYE